MAWKSYPLTIAQPRDMDSWRRSEESAWSRSIPPSGTELTYEPVPEQIRPRRRGKRVTTQEARRMILDLFSSGPKPIYLTRRQIIKLSGLPEGTVANNLAYLRKEKHLDLISWPDATNQPYQQGSYFRYAWILPEDKHLFPVASHEPCQGFRTPPEDTGCRTGLSVD